jgi:poly(3-hydroxybutyrate) depolymerase
MLRNGLLLLLMSFAGCAVAPSLKDVWPGVVNYQIDPVTGARFYLYLPKSYDPSKIYPVIVTCHGTIPYDTAWRHIYSLDDYGEKYDYIIVAPELHGTDGIFGDGPIDGMLKNERDIVSFLSRLGYQFNIDRANILITGFSGGGFPAYWVGLRHPDIFSVIVGQNSNFNKPNTEGWWPKEALKTPIMVYWGEHDPDTIRNQSADAVAYLTKKGFNLRSRVLRGAGHDRHPEVAVAFFRKNWNTPVSSQPATRPSAGKKIRAKEGSRTTDKSTIDVDSLPRGPRPPSS